MKKFPSVNEFGRITKVQAKDLLKARISQSALMPGMGNGSKIPALMFYEATLRDIVGANWKECLPEDKYKIQDNVYSKHKNGGSCAVYIERRWLEDLGERKYTGGLKRDNTPRAL